LGFAYNPLSAWQPSQQKSRLLKAIPGRVWLLTVEIFTLALKTNLDEYRKYLVKGNDYISIYILFRNGQLAFGLI
jgi:hypothetical protein